MSDITVINDSEQSSLVTNGLAKNGELYLKAAGSTDAGAIVVYDSGVWRTFANEASSFSNTYSVSFDGTNDYVDTGNKFDFMQQTMNFTISAWIKFQDYTLARNQYILHTTDSGSRVGFMLWFDNRSGLDYLRSRIAPTSSTNAYAQSTYAISDNNWHHVAVTCAQAGSIRLYVDGSQLDFSSAPSTTTATAQHNFIIGGALDTSGQIFLPFQGNIDEVGIFNTELSSSDITSIYNSGSPDDLSSLNPVSWWRMGDNDGGTGTTITDQGSGGNDGTLVNSPTFYDLSTAPDSIYVA